MNVYFIDVVRRQSFARTRQNKRTESMRVFLPGRCHRVRFFRMRKKRLHAPDFAIHHRQRDRFIVSFEQFRVQYKEMKGSAFECHKVIRASRVIGKPFPEMQPFEYKFRFFTDQRSHQTDCQQKSRFVITSISEGKVDELVFELKVCRRDFSFRLFGLGLRQQTHAGSSVSKSVMAERRRR